MLSLEAVQAATGGPNTVHTPRPFAQEACLPAMFTPAAVTSLNHVTLHGMRTEALQGLHHQARRR